MRIETLAAINKDINGHAYEIEVNAKGDFVTVLAMTRSQAAKCARDHGYTVHSVNMVD